MKLRDLLPADAALAPREGDIDIAGLTADSRAVKRGDVFFAVPGSKTDGLRFVEPAVAAGAVAVIAQRMPVTPVPEGVVFVRVANAQARARARCGEIFSAPARDHRRRHRHERQNLGRRVHAPDLERAQASRCEHRHDRPGLAEGRNLRLADHAGSGRSASHARRACRRGRHPSRPRGVVARPRPAPARRRAPRGGGLHQPHARSSRLSPDASKPISPPSCGCSRNWSPRGGAAVIDVDNDHAEAVDGGRQGARPYMFIGVGRNGTGIRLVECEIDGFSQTLQRRASASEISSVPPAAGRRVPGRECAGRRRSRHRDRRHIRARCFWRSRVSRAPRAGSSLSASSKRRADLRRLRAQARRARQGARRAAALRAPAGSSSCSAPAATAIAASGR